MSKPINVEATRVIAILGEMKEKMEIVELLRSEFFEEILKPDAPDMIERFGDQLGTLMHHHAQLEASFKATLKPDGKVNDDNFQNEESKAVEADLNRTTAKLIRAFSTPDRKLQLK